jgi:DNA invertase Pin-like site-specific DNA recombinase
MDSPSTTPTNTRLPLRAAQYVRMSTEHQRYSPENQLENIRQYAVAHQMEIVQEHANHGRSGLNIAGREGLNRLMEDVETNRIGFSASLVYDVDLCECFQKVDESTWQSKNSHPAKLVIHIHAGSPLGSGGDSELKEHMLFGIRCAIT